MFKLKNFKGKYRQENSKKYPLKENGDQFSSTSSVYTEVDEKEVTLLTGWLNELNRENLILMSDQDDIIIMAGGQNNQDQQIFINSSDIDHYVDRYIHTESRFDQPQTISMSDIARILLQFGYINDSSGQLSYSPHRISMSSKELRWLISIIEDIQPNPSYHESDVRLFDGENSVVISIPHEYLTPTNDKRIVGNYLFRNGLIKYNVDNGSYAYRYIEPDLLLDKQIKSSERLKQHEFLSFHILHIHIDQFKKSIQLQFRYELNQNLLLPNHWYRQIMKRHFDKDYIIDILLSNGAFINKNALVFMGQTYSLEAPTKTNFSFISSTNLKRMNLPLKEKSDLIHHYVDLIIEQDGARLDQTNQLFLLENEQDGQRLYFTNIHSKFIKENQFKRTDVIDILIQYGDIKQDPYSNCLFLFYNHQLISFPSSTLSPYNNNQKFHQFDNSIPSSIEQTFLSNRTSLNGQKDYSNLIDYMCHNGLVTWDKPSKVIRIHFSDQTLLLPIDHLNSIINPNLLSLSSTNNNILPFTSQQLFQWLKTNSYITQQKIFQ